MKFNIKFKNNMLRRCVAVCFGNLNSCSYTEIGPSNLDASDFEHPSKTPLECVNIFKAWIENSEQESFSDKIKLIQLPIEQAQTKYEFWFKPKGDGTEIHDSQSGVDYKTYVNKSLKNLIPEIKKLVEDLPMFDSVVRFYPKSRRLDFLCGDNPADKVMLCAFLFRNIVIKQNTIAYQLFRVKGYRPRFAAIMSMLYSPSLERVYPEHVSFAQYLRRLFLSEDSFVDESFFGMNALLKFMRQDYSDDVWRQKPFKDQPSGYMRDSHYKSSGVIWDKNSILSEDNEYYDDWDSDCNLGRGYYMNLAKTLCLLDDTPKPCESVDVDEKFFMVEHLRGGAIENERLYDEIVNPIVDFLTENGVNVYD